MEDTQEAEEKGKLGGRCDDGVHDFSDEEELRSKEELASFLTLIQNGNHIIP